MKLRRVGRQICKTYVKSKKYFIFLILLLKFQWQIGNPKLIYLFQVSIFHKQRCSAVIVLLSAENLSYMQTKVDAF